MPAHRPCRVPYLLSECQLPITIRVTCWLRYCWFLNFGDKGGRTVFFNVLPKKIKKLSGIKISFRIRPFKLLSHFNFSMPQFFPFFIKNIFQFFTIEMTSGHYYLQLSKFHSDIFKIDRQTELKNTDRQTVGQPSDFLRVPFLFFWGTVP